MRVKAKKCKGTGKAKGHGCGCDSLKRTYGLCDTCYRFWLLNTDIGNEHLRKATLTGKKKVAKEIKAENYRIRKEYRESRKSIARLITEARIPFQKWIRLRDANFKCISCGTTNSHIWDGGHYYKAEIYSGLIFDERNVHKQCRKCNSFQGGNETGYRLGLIERYGESKIIAFEKEAIGLRDYKYSREEIKEIKLKYLQKLKYYDNSRN